MQQILRNHKIFTPDDLIKSLGYEVISSFLLNKHNRDQVSLLTNGDGLFATCTVRESLISMCDTIEDLRYMQCNIFHDLKWRGRDHLIGLLEEEGFEGYLELVQSEYQIAEKLQLTMIALLQGS